MPGIKHQKHGGLLNSAEINKHNYSQTDSAYDFFNRHTILHGELPVVLVANAVPMYLGPINELTIQPAGGATVTVQASLDGVTFVAANAVTSADGFIRIQSKYMWFKIGVQGGTAYMMTS
jgi:hypothetical protein